LIQHTQRFKDIVGSTQDQLIKTIQAFAQHPSADRKCIKFAIYKDRQNAIAEAKGVTLAMYTDRSRRNRLVGIAVVWKTKDLPALGLQGLVQHYVRGTDWIKTWETTDLQANSNEYAAELAAILRALQILKVQPGSSNRQVTILTDCLSAIQSIQKPRFQSRQYILQQIWHTAKQLYNQGTMVTIQ
jgi:ribonuclease HI